MLGIRRSPAAPLPPLEVESLALVRDHVVFEHRHHRGLLPLRGHYLPVNQPKSRLRGVPTILPMDRAGLNTQRIGSVGLILGVVAGLAPGAAIPLLIGAVGFQLGFGVRQGVRMAWNFGKQQKTLNGEKAQLPLAPYTNPTAAAVARLNKENGLRAKTSYLPAGFLSSIVTILAASSTLTRPALFGHFSLGAVAAGAVLIHVAVPLISLFSTTSAIYGLYYISFTYKQQKHIADVLKTPVTGHEPLALELMKKRLHTQRVHSAWSTAANFGMAAGAPLLLAVGPYALIPLVPAAVGSAVTSYTWSRKVAYLPQFTQPERLAHKSRHGLVNEVARAHHNYDALKTIKGGLRPLYPYASQSPVRHFVKAKAKVHRWLHRKEISRLPFAEDTVRSYWSQHMAAEKEFQQGVVRIAQHKLASKEKAGNERCAEHQRERIAAAEAAIVKVDSAVASTPGRGLDHTVSRFNWLVDWLVENKAFPAFARALINDKALFVRWKNRGIPSDKKQWVIDAGALKKAFAAETFGTQEYILQHAFVQARTALLTFQKLAYQYRSRELLDILAVHLRCAAQMRQAKKSAVKAA